MHFGLSRGGTLGLVVIVLLALVWALLLLPSMFRRRVAASPMDGVRRFEQTMGILESTRRPKPAASGRWIVIPRNINTQSRRRNRVIRRRRQSFVRLLALAVVSLILVAVPHLRWMIWVHAAADVVLAGYVWRLLVYKQRERQAARVVTELPSDDGADVSPGSPRHAVAK